MAFDLAETVQPYTMATPERVRLVIELCERANKEGIDGDFVECGCCNGGLSAVLAHYGIDRTTWLFDSFQGLPQCGPKDLPSANGNTAQSEVGKAIGTFEKVAEAINKATGGTGYEWPKVNIVKGWFADTFPRIEISKIAVLLLDSDWYESEKLCLETFYNSVVRGGFVYIDDYFYWPGCKSAADEFWLHQDEGLLPIVNRVGHSAWLQR